MSTKPGKRWWGAVVGILFMVGAFGWLLAALKRGDTVYWVMFSSTFVLGLFFLNAANARRRAAQGEGRRPRTHRPGPVTASTTGNGEPAA
jgi:hypothetical protein